jgi:hypothetical protein
VQILRENGESLPTYAMRDRFYVQGSANERYVIRISNPTPRRIEAVVSVDGLDVIDGENGDLRKRGYVVPAYGETRIEGFRTSTSDVATFRFSSVSGSYAGQKGKARNVGVIAVALFEEQQAEPDQIIVGEAPPPPPRYRRPYDYRDDIDADGRGAPSADAAPQPAPRDVAKSESGTVDRGGDRRADQMPSNGRVRQGTAHKAAKRSAEAPAARPVPAPTRGGGGYAPPSEDDGFDEEVVAPEPQQQRPSRERLGLGTEFGEQRYSAASFTRFVRGSGRPVAIAELRYNDVAGLTALGILVQPLPDPGEIMTRETADPFPGDRFARPVR